MTVLVHYTVDCVGLKNGCWFVIMSESKFKQDPHETMCVYSEEST